MAPRRCSKDGPELPAQEPAEPSGGCKLVFVTPTRCKLSPFFCSAESEMEQAAAIGACRVLEGRGLWRYIQRDWAATRAMLLALLASGEGRV